MKKLLIIISAFMIFCTSFTVMANSDSLPDYSQMSDIELLARGIIVIREDMTLEDFYETMKIIDDSDNHLNSDKFVYFCYAIEQLYYESITAEELFRLFAEQNRYLDTSDMNEVYTKLFSLLDKYSYYIDPERSEKFWNPTSSLGVGITFVYDDTGSAWGSVGTFVEGIASDSAAAEADILIGDKLISINGICVENMPFTGVSAILSSLKDEDLYISLSYRRVDGDKTTENSVILQRRITNFREISFHLYPEKKTFMVSIERFSNMETYKELISRFTELKNAGYQNVIVDLRDNSGGDVQVATSIVSAFLPNSQVIFTMGKEEEKNIYTFNSPGIGVEFNNVYVLVNENTASSAEITALCLKQHANAQLIGTQTVGKAVAQTAGQIIDGSTFGITTFIAYDSFGNTYNGKGLLPRYYIENEIEKYDFPSDLEWFNYINYVEAFEGARNEVVTALERRLEIMGFLKAEFVDGYWDEETTFAIMALQASADLETTGVLNEELVIVITDRINSYKEIYTVIDRQLETAFSLIY